MVLCAQDFLVIRIIEIELTNNPVNAGPTSKQLHSPYFL